MKKNIFLTTVLFSSIFLSNGYSFSKKFNVKAISNYTQQQDEQLTVAKTDEQMEAIGDGYGDIEEVTIDTIVEINPNAHDDNDCLYHRLLNETIRTLDNLQNEHNIVDESFQFQIDNNIAGNISQFFGAVEAKTTREMQQRLTLGMLNVVFEMLPDTTHLKSNLVQDLLKLTILPVSEFNKDETQGRQNLPMIANGDSRSIQIIQYDGNPNQIFQIFNPNDTNEYINCWFNGDDAENYISFGHPSNYNSIVQILQNNLDFLMPLNDTLMENFFHFFKESLMPAVVESEINTSIQSEVKNSLINNEDFIKDTINTAVQQTQTKDKQTIRSLTQKNKELQSIINTLKDVGLVDLVKEKNQLTESKTTLEQHVQGLTETNRRLTQSNTDLTQSNTGLQTQVQELTKSNEELKEQAETLQKNILNGLAVSVLSAINKKTEVTDVYNAIDTQLQMAQSFVGKDFFNDTVLKEMSAIFNVEDTPSYQTDKSLNDVKTYFESLKIKKAEEEEEEEQEEQEEPSGETA